MAEIKITLVRSPIGCNKNQKANLKALGLTKINKTVTKQNSAFIQGMIKKNRYTYRVEEI